MLRLFLTFCKIGLLGFGGGLAIISLMYDNICDFVGLTQQQFANIVAIAQVTPGPVAVNAGTYVGFEFAGIPGALVATVGVLLLPFVLTLIACRLVTRFKTSLVVRGALEGIRPATVGLVATALITVATPAIVPESHIGSSLLAAAGTLGQWLNGLPVDPIAILIAVVTMVLIGKYKKSPFIVLMVMGVIGGLLGM